MKGREEGEKRERKKETEGGVRERERDSYAHVSCASHVRATDRQTERHKERPSVSQMQRDGKGKRGQSYFTNK